MVEIVGVGFAKTGKTYYFDPQGQKYEAGDMVIVETARGMELGRILIENRKIDIYRADQQSQLRAAKNDALSAATTKVSDDTQEMVL